MAGGSAQAASFPSSPDTGAPTIGAQNLFSYQSLKPTIDQNSGALTQRIQLDIPPGRNGLQPDLALEYNSQNTNDGIVGYGWTLTIPYIERLNKAGSERLYSDGYFTSSLGGELATTTSTSSPTEYRHKFEDGRFIRYTFTNNTWTAYDKNGTKYTFGLTDQSRQFATTSSSSVVKWMVEEIRDANDNYISFTYSKDGNQLYPSQITYTGHGSTDGPFSITFATSTRPDPYIKYEGGIKITTDYRISQITASVNGTQVRRYTLGYAAGDNGVRSLLSSIQLTGRDSNGVELSEPTTTFQYSASSTSFATSSPGISNWAYIAADVNGNGRNDLSVHYHNTSDNGDHIYYVRDGETTETVSVTPPTDWANYNSGASPPYTPVEAGVRFFDVNGDGKADVVRGWHDDYTGATTTLLWLNTYATSTGYAWATTTPIGDIPVFGWTDHTYTLTTGLLGDINGDGIPDYVKAIDKAGNVRYLGNGTGWNATTTIFSPVDQMPGTGGPGSNSQLIDINGDGLDDWVYSDASSTYVKLNTGTGWESSPDSHWTIATSTFYAHTQSGTTAYWDRGVRFLDVNGDGLVDFVRAYNMPTYGTCITGYTCPPPPETETVKVLYLNTGSGWVATTTIPLPSGYIEDAGMSGGNWDGQLHEAEWSNWLHNGQNDQDVLTQINYPRGGNTQIAYIPTAFTSTNPELSTSLLVVQKITTSDNNGNTETTSYSYEGGKLYLANGVRDKRFAGFSKITETKADSVTTTYFNQGDGVSSSPGEQSDGYWLIGKPFRQDVTALATTTVYKRSYYRWDSSNGTTTQIMVSQQQPASISRDATSTGTGSAVSSITFSHTTSGSDRALVVGCYVSTGPSVTATYNGTSMTAVNVMLPWAYGRYAYLFYLLNPASGTHNVVVSASASADFSCRGSSYSNVSGTDGTATDSNTNTTSWGNTLTTTTDNDWLVAQTSGENTVSAGSGTSNVAGEVYDSNGSVGAAGSHSLNFTQSPSGGIASAILGLTPTSTTVTVQVPATSTNMFATFTYMANELDEDFNSSGSHRDHGIAYTYDATTTGSLIKETDYGEVTGNSDGTFTDTGSDRRTKDLSYAFASTTNVTVPSQETLSDNSGTRVKETKYYYDGLSLGNVSTGNPTKEEDWITGSTYASSTKTYNSYGLPTETRDARYKPTTYVYDSYNLYPATTTDALSHSSQAYYDYATGKAIKKVDANGYTWASILDPLGRLKEEKIPDPSSGTEVTKATYSYSDNAFPNYQQTTSYLNGATSTDAYTYFDGVGRVIQERAEATSTSFIVKDKTYSNAGVLYRESLPYFSTGASSTSATTSAALWVTYLYDGLHRPTEVGNAVGTTTYAYDRWKTTQTDALSHAKDLTNDAYGNLVQVDEHNATSTYSTYYEYDPLNNLTKITDALGNIRNFTYDGLSRRLTAQDLHASGDATFGTWTYTYDDAGNMTQLVDPKSQTINYTYDDLNRPLTEDYTGQSGTEVTYTYDSCTNGILHLCVASSTYVIASSTYDTVGNLASETRRIDNTDYTTSYAYDRLGNLTSVTYPNTAIAQYWYNPAGMLERVAYKKPGGSFVDAVKNIDYAPTGKVRYKLFGNGVESTYTYDPSQLYRLTNILTDTLIAGGNGGAGVLALAKNNVWIEGLALAPKAPLAQLRGPIDLLPATTTPSTTSSIGSDSSSTNLEAIVSEIAATTTEQATSSALSAATSSAETSNATVSATSTVADTTAASATHSASSSAPAIGSEATSTPVDSLATTAALQAATSTATTTELVATSTAATSTVTALLTDKTARERAGIKGREIAKIGSIPRTRAGDYDIQVASIEAIPGGVQVLARAWNKDGSQIGFGRDGTVELERFRIFNPPILVPDGTMVTATSTLPGGAIDTYRVNNYKEDPAAALLQTLSQTIAIKREKFGPEGIVAGKEGHTTSIYYPLWQGEVRRGDSLSESWSTIRGGSGTTVSNDNTEMYAPFVNADSSSNAYQLHQITFFPFDTSDIGSDTISSATFSVVGMGDWTGNGDLNINISGATITNPVATSDYQNTVSNYSTKYASDKTISSFATDDSTYNDFAFNSSGIAAINATGTTKIAMRFSIDVTGSGTPSWSSLGQSGIHHRSSGYTGTSKDPKLVIEHSATPTSSGGFQNLTYTYDAVGNITTIADSSDTLTKRTVNFTYDDLNRLLIASTTAATSTPYTETYMYDAIGNLLSKINTGSYTYAGTGYANPDAPTTIGSTSYSYDNNGNLTSAGSTNYTWDYKNRLTQVSTTTNLSYTYDDTPYRVKMFDGTATTTYPSRYYSIQGATTTAYIYAGDSLIAYIEGNGSATSTRYVHPDHLGSTGVITDGSMGGLIQSFDYYPYGTPRINSGAAPLDKQYIGERYDTADQLNYLNNRYTDSYRGQFLSEDPMFLAIGNPSQLQQLSKQDQQKLLSDPQSLNSYGYGRDNPIRNKDATGLCFEPLSALVCAYTAYTAATLAIDAYDVYQTNLEYGDVFAQEEKNRTNFKAGLDVVLTLTGAKLVKTAGEAAGVGFDTLTAGLDTINTYFSDQAYKKYNEDRDPNRKKDTPISTSPRSTVSSVSSNIQTSNVYVNNTRQASQYSTPSQNGGYSQLVSNLSRLVASLQAYVAGLSGSQNNR